MREGGVGGALVRCTTSERGSAPGETVEGQSTPTDTTDTVVRNNKRKLEDPLGLTHDAAQEYVSDYDEEELEE